MNIHTSELVEVHHQPADSDALWVFFGSSGDAAPGEDFWGATLARRAGIAAVGVRIRTTGACSPRDFAAAATAIRAVAKGHRSIVALGQRRGGHAALVHGDDIGAGTILAFSLELPSGVPACQVLSTIASSYVFGDGPSRQGTDSPFRIAMRGAGPTFPPFAGTPALTSLITACVANDRPLVQHLASRARRLHRDRIPNLVEALQSRRPALAKAIMARYPERFAPPRSASSPSRWDTRPPVITVFGSCRVYDPCAMLAAKGRAVLNQSNIFGYVHCAAEVLQQIRLISGEITAPGRLRPYLNIGERWKTPAADTIERRFAATDVFVVEVSSVRLLRFKAFLLQLNRTRELLASNPQVLQNWWNPLLRTGRNIADAIPDHSTAPAGREIMSGLALSEQTAAALTHDVEAIAARLGKPVLFVSHFNVDMAGAPIPQRTTIIDALAAAQFQTPCAILDPTAAVRKRGVADALLDPAHYQPTFRHQVADLLAARVAALRPG